MADEKAQGAEEAQVKVNFRVPSRMPSVYAHHMLIQPGQNEVLLSFFEILPPVVLDDMMEDRLKALRETGVVAECVARIIIARQSFPDFVKAMQQSVERLGALEEPQENVNHTRDNPAS